MVNSQTAGTPALKHKQPANGQDAPLTLDTAVQREARRDARRTAMIQSSPWGTV